MTREQTAALALLIARGAGNAFDMGRPGDSPQGLAQAALQYASACGWTPTNRVMVVQSRAGDALESILAEERGKVAALAGVLRAVLAAAQLDGTSGSQPNLDNALDAARDVLSRVR